jgi:hypothetical protein
MTNFQTNPENPVGLENAPRVIFPFKKSQIRLSVKVMAVFP